MWVWAFNLKTKGDIDEMVGWATGRMTDIYVFAIDDSVTPRTWLGTASHGTSNATSIDGKTPWKYCYDLAHAAGIRMHAWMWISTFSYIGGPNGVDPTIPDNSTYNDAGTWNFHDATARSRLVSEVADFIANNDVDGINFNSESTTANITTQDMTDLMTEMRAAFPTLELSICVGAKITDDIALKFDTVTWVNTGLVDTIALMGYYDDTQIKKVYTDTLTLPPRHLMVGVGCESNSARASDIRHKWLDLIADGYTDYALFCWGGNVDDDLGIQAAIDAYLNNTLAAVQADITALSSTSTSFAITVGGVVQNIVYTDVADHIYSGPLKQHIEAVYGENPAVIYARAGTTSTRILIGDFEP